MDLRWRMAVAALALALPARAPGQSTPTLISGHRVVIVDNTDATKRKLSFISKDAALDAAPGTGIDPVTNGLFFHVFNSAGTGDSACLSLPASGWKRKGSTLRYKDASFALGPCKSAILKNGKLFKASCSAKEHPIDYTLDEPAQATVAVRLVSGERVFCADFGARAATDKPGKKYRGKKEPAPGLCPVPPEVCP